MNYPYQLIVNINHVELLIVRSSWLSSHFFLMYSGSQNYPTSVIFFSKPIFQRKQKLETSGFHRL